MSVGSGQYLEGGPPFTVRLLGLVHVVGPEMVLLVACPYDYVQLDRY